MFKYTQGIYKVIDAPMWFNTSHVFYTVHIEKSLNLLIMGLFSDFAGQEIYNLSDFDFCSTIYMRLP